MRIRVVALSALFVFLSFLPSFDEIRSIRKLPENRTFTLDHNYLFDYNFYLSRIREGSEGRWLVTEKYYNQPHKPSLFQIFYLVWGKLGYFGFDPPTLYHAARVILGFLLLVCIGLLAHSLFPGWRGTLAFLLIITSGSWPIPVLAGGGWRFATHMGWWSVIDSLQRITTIPHVLFGQIFLLVFVWHFSNRSPTSHTVRRMMAWGILGLIVGIVFPPTLVILYAYFAVLSLFETVACIRKKQSRIYFSVSAFKTWLRHALVPRSLFVILSFPSFLYLQAMFTVPPWSALALFDIEHRIGLPYREYALALGPVLPFGLAGFVLACVRKEKRLISMLAWVVSVGLLFAVFERVPTQSPLRFTEAALHVPLGILTAYLFYQLYHVGNRSNLGYLGRKTIRTILIVGIASIILMGLGVMWSMELWLTDQNRAKREGTFPVPIGAQLVYPLKDFMNGVSWLRDNTRKEDVVLGYVTAGNFIPAYAGNYVYIGHANTPDEDEKEPIVSSFFAGKMEQGAAQEFLVKERIRYVYFGPQEKEQGSVEELSSVYSFLTVIYTNPQVKIYRVSW